MHLIFAMMKEENNCLTKSDKIILEDTINYLIMIDWNVFWFY